MKPQFGVCKNKVGCSFAYTGEKIPVPADSKCPECGQPLTVDSSKRGGAKILVVLGLLLLPIVYVDNPIWPYRGMLMCHMIADTPEELHAMAD